MKTARRILCLLLALLMISVSLFAVSCGKEEEETEATEVTTTEAGEERFPAPPVKDYGGMVFNILTLTGSSLLEGVEGDSEQVSAALVERTLWLESTYNVDLTLSTVDDGNDYIALQNSYLGGLREYDMIVPHPSKYMASMMASGMMQDLNACEEIDLSKPWWNQSQVENYSIQGKLFFGIGDFNLNKRGFSVFVFNKDRFDSLGFGEDIYDIVDNGQWTLDKMYEYTIVGYDDLGDPERNNYGFAYNKSVASFYYWSGETLLKRNDAGDLELKYDVDRVSAIADKVTKIVKGDHTLMSSWYNNSFAESTAWTAFQTGRLLMFGIDLGAHGHMLRDISFNTAYAPPPKFDETQANYTQICGAGQVGIPNDAKDISCSALILEALNWHSYYNFRPVYFDTYMSYMVSKNENDYRMLEIVLDNTVYDLGYTLDSEGIQKGKGLGIMDAVVLNGEGVSSYVQQNEAAANNAYQNIIKDIY